jgi:hypothetical protein
MIQVARLAGHALQHLLAKIDLGACGEEVVLAEPADQAAVTSGAQASGSQRGYFASQSPTRSRARRRAASPPTERRSASHSKPCSAMSQSRAAPLGDQRRDGDFTVWPAKTKVPSSSCAPVSALPGQGSLSAAARAAGARPDSTRR